MMRTLLIASLAMATCVAAPAHAAFDCGRLQNIDSKNIQKVNPRHVEECISRGFDLSPQLRPGGGRGGRVNVGGGGGFSTLNVQAPDRPPATRGYGASVSQAKMGFALSFPPWPGFPCQLPGGQSICGGGDDDSGDEGTTLPICNPAAAGSGGPTDPSRGACTATPICDPAASGTGGPTDPAGGGCATFCDSAAAAGSDADPRGGTCIDPLTGLRIGVTPGGSGGGGTSGGQSSCPMANDSTGTFGQKMPLGTATSYSLTCGGAIPLTTYQMTLSKNPQALAATEHNSPYLWVYKKSGNGYSSTAQPLPLPTFLCRPTGKKGAMEQSITLTGPRAQFIAYDANARYIAVRLIVNPESDTLDNVSPLSPLTNSEKYLRIPIQGGQPVVPTNCADEAQYYVPGANLGGAITIETALEPGCEATPAQCAQAGVSTTPTATVNCDTVTVHLSGGTAAAPGAATCTDMTQIMVVDRPNLLHLPGQSAKFASITGRTARMAATSAGSIAYLPSENIIRLNASSDSFVLPEGGTLGLTNGKLIMYGPATLSPGSGQVVMTEGGEFRDAAGNTVTTYAKNSAMRPSDGFPWLVQTSRSIVMPTGFELPTQPNPYIRAPLATP